MATRYRGPLAIHAAMGFPDAAQKTCLTEPFRTVLKNQTDIKVIWDKVNRTSDFPLGKIIAVCELKYCIMVPAPYKGFGVQIDLLSVDPFFQDRFEVPPKEPELSFGDYTPGRYAWILTNIRALDVPIPAKGALGLWEWTKEDW